MPEIRVNDVELHYDVQGSGDPLLVVMGLGSSSAAWNPELIAGLAQSFRVITYDNRGTGRSDKPDIPYSLEMFAADAIALLDALKLDRVHLFGVSMGGMIAQELALRYAPRLQDVDARLHHVQRPKRGSAAAGITQTAHGAARRRLGGGHHPPRLAVGLHAGLHPGLSARLEDSIPRLLAHPTPVFAYKRHLDATYGLKTYDRIPAITTPTLVITGAEDVLIPAKNAEILAQRIPRRGCMSFRRWATPFSTKTRRHSWTRLCRFQSYPLNP